MAKQFRGTQIRAFPRRFNCYTLFAIIAQFCAMKWHKRKKSLHTIPHNGIAIGTPICWYVVNVLLLKLRPELYQSRYNPLPINVNQDTNSSVITVKPKDTISSTLNVTQGHKSSYQTSS